MHTWIPDGDEDSLKALIKARQQSREEQVGGFFDSLEEKYCKKPKTAISKGGSKSQKSSKKASANDSGSSSKSTRSKSAKQTKK